jgi:hypothetical protein
MGTIHEILDLAEAGYDVPRASSRGRAVFINGNDAIALRDAILDQYHPAGYGTLISVREQPDVNRTTIVEWDIGSAD